MPSSTNPRFFLDQDGDSHWYLVEAAHRKDWDEWTALDPETEEAWRVPDFAERINGHPSLVEFIAPHEI